MLRRLLAAGLLAAATAIPQFIPAHAAPAFSHVYVIMEENTDYNDIIGNLADAPYINSLAQQNGFAANYYGVTHPSLPNYIASTSGDIFGSHSDDPKQVFHQTNIVDQLEGKGLTWGAYMQGLPSVGFTGPQDPATGTGLYVIKHNPFGLFSDIVTNTARLQHVKPASQLATDLAGGTAPNYVWISPDECHDMHGVSPPSAAQYGIPACGYPPTNVTAHALIQAGDTYLQQLVTTIQSSKAWTADSLIMVTWDENEFAGSAQNRGYNSNTGCCASPANDGGGRVPAIVITNTPNHTVSLHPYNHYSMLRTIQDNFGLGCSNNTCDPAVQPMSDLLNQTATSLPLAQTNGFAVTFSSQNAGQGYVLFGPGPGCTGLVETGLYDLGTNSKTHTVLVTGNDLAGTIGNIGLTPGATYWYEAATLTSSGTEVNNNGGQCYSVTIAKPA